MLSAVDLTPVALNRFGPSIQADKSCCRDKVVARHHPCEVGPAKRDRELVWYWEQGFERVAHRSGDVFRMCAARAWTDSRASQTTPGPRGHPVSADTRGRFDFEDALLPRVTDAAGTRPAPLPRPHHDVTRPGACNHWSTPQERACMTSPDTGTGSAPLTS